MKTNRAFLAPSSRALLGCVLALAAGGLSLLYWHSAVRGPLETLAWLDAHRAPADSAAYASAMYHAAHAQAAYIERWGLTGYATLGTVGTLAGLLLMLSSWRPRLMSLSRSAVLWATPLAFVVHNAEEAWTFPRYIPRVQAQLPEALRMPAIPIVGIETALVVATAAFLALAVWATMRPHSPVACWAALLVPAVGALNALVHVGSAVFFLHGYSPGVITAVCLVAPISGFVLRRAWREHWLSPSRWRLLGLAAVLIHGPLLMAVLFFVARAG